MTRHVHDRKRILRMKKGPGRRPGNNTVKSTTGQRAFPLHMFFGVVLFASISKYGLVQFWPLSLSVTQRREKGSRDNCLRMSACAVVLATFLANCHCA